MNTIFKEPSTWAGVAAVVQALKAAFPLYGAALDVATAAAGALAMILRERGNEK
jgi:hypothetical protein